MLLPVKHLRNGGTLADLETRYAIKVRRHGRFPNLVLLKYDQINSPMAEPLVQQCRALILDEADNWRPVAVPFFKFFNHGEPNAALLDWSTARVQEKLDGSLMTLYSHGDEWHVSSSGLPDAEGPTGHGFTFHELFWRTWDQLGYALPVDANCCYMFELMTPYNRVVVPHKQSRIVLHGVRQLDTLREVGLHNWPWETVREFPLNSLEAILTACAALNPLECEGYVVVDGGFNRVKVKSPQYVALAHMKDGMSTRRMLEIVRANESDEFLTHFPEFREMYDDVRGRFDALIAELDADYASIGHLSSQKDFALQACKSRCSSALFALRASKVSNLREFFAGATIQAVERALGLKEPEMAVS